MILLIDNYDSFTYNLYQYLAELGAEVVVRRNDRISLAEVDALHPDGIVISPGPKTPTEAGISVGLIHRLGGFTPTLGVCLGHQCIGQAFGGKIVRAPELKHGKTSQVYHSGTGVLRGLPSPMVAGRYHSLVVERASIPDQLEVTAETADGLVMGLRHRSRPIEGVQFHPESVLTPMGKQLLRNFVDGLRTGDGGPRTEDRGRSVPEMGPDSRLSSNATTKPAGSLVRGPTPERPYRPDPAGFPLGSVSVSMERGG